MREIIEAICSCGGEVSEVNTTPEEEDKYGCGRSHCCCRAFQCNKCNTRFTLEFEAPEIYD